MPNGDKILLCGGAVKKSHSPQHYLRTEKDSNDVCVMGTRIILTQRDRTREIGTVQLTRHYHLCKNNQKRDYRPPFFFIMSSEITSNISPVEEIPVVVAIGLATTVIVIAKVDDDDDDDANVEENVENNKLGITMTLSEDENSVTASAYHDKDPIDIISSDEEDQGSGVSAEKEKEYVIHKNEYETDDDAISSDDTNGPTHNQTTEHAHDDIMVGRIEEGSMSDTTTTSDLGHVDHHHHDHHHDGLAPPFSSQNRSSLSLVFFCPITKQLFRDPVVAPDGITYERQAILQQKGGKTPCQRQPNPTSGGGSVVVVLAAAEAEEDDEEDEEQQLWKNYYPNRALQQVLAERQRLLLLAVGAREEEDDYSMRSKLLRLQKKIMTSPLDRKSEPIHTTTTTTMNANTTTTTTTTARTKHCPLPEAYYCPITFGLMHDPVIDPDGNTYERRSIQLWIRANHTSPLSRRPLEESQLYDNTALRQIMQEEAECCSDDASSLHPSIQKWKNEPTPEPLLPPIDVVVVVASSSFTNSNREEARAAEWEALRQQEMFQTKLWCIFSVCVLILMVYLKPSSGIVLAMVYIAFVCCYTNIPDESGRRATNSLLPPPTPPPTPPTPPPPP
jgi:hypothetical protein